MRHHRPGVACGILGTLGVCPLGTDQIVAPTNFDLEIAPLESAKSV